jgi:hydroxyethylthiazole kinase-like uncharacterized protein yjeF
MKIVSSSTMRELDSRTINDFGIPGSLLMERAGRGVAEAVEELAVRAMDGIPSVLMVAGHGNNGGDVFVAARYLAACEADVAVWLTCTAEDLKGDAAHHFQLMIDDGIMALELPNESDWEDVNDTSCDVIVDGILGTGIKGAANGVASAAIRYINDLSYSCLVVAVDIPSGLDADTGEAAGDVVVADMTVTMALPKDGLVEARAREYVGQVRVIDIGVPDELVEAATSSRDLVVAQDLFEILPRRKRQSHKGTYGHVLVIGGAAGFAGAAALAGRGALRSGAGLVSLLVPQSMVPAILAAAPELMVHGAEETDIGSLSADSLSKWDKEIAEFDAILIGPGMTTHQDSGAIVEQVLKQATVPVVVDADALNACAGNLNILKSAGCPVVITPHPGEMARLCDCTTDDVQSGRTDMASKVSKEASVVVVLKGSGTVIASSEVPVSINLTGNPGMASGGTGDVLSGVIVSLLAQGIGPFDACRAGVYLHGLAGDRAAWRLSQTGMVAGDLIDELPGVFRDIVGR